MNLYEIAKACNGRLVGDGNIEVAQYSNDTRTLQAGALYIPIVGEVFDGHAFISKAFESGAVATLSSKEEERKDDADYECGATAFALLFHRFPSRACNARF